MSAAIVQLRAPPPRYDAMTIERMSFIPAGHFEALGPPPSGQRGAGVVGGRWRFGKLGVDRIPAWATRVHLSPEDFRELIGVVRPDEERNHA